MKDFLKVIGPVVALVLVGVLISVFVMGPPPPKTVSVSGGAAGGAYAQAAEGFKQVLETKKVTVDVINTAGSLENLDRLRNGETDIAIVQTGLAEAAKTSPTSDDEAQELMSLGAIFYEPLWVFHRTHDDDGHDVIIQDLRDLVGKRIAIGEAGAGGRALAELLLTEVGIDADEYTAIPLGGTDAANAVRAGSVDVAMMVSGAKADWLAGLVAAPSVKLLSMSRASGLARRHPYLDEVTLHAGVLDPERGLPAQDITMLAPAAEIVVREKLHPAIQSLLIEAAFKLHSDGTTFADPGVFPTQNLADIPVSDEARRYYKDGPTFLRRIFPFDWANFLERAWVLAIPLLTLAYPLVKAAPPVYRWRIRRKIYVWYSDLRELESEGREAATTKQRQDVRKRLGELQRETGEVEVPLSYNDDLYRLRAHIRFVIDLLDTLAAEDQAA